ncbi:MAG: hypothetical protein RL319_860 [Actinomycetota bacterium]|jgi:hypothetical protein
MALKSILNELGVTHFHRFSPVFTNWYRQFKQVEEQGQAVRPLRVGAKRIVLVLDKEQRRTRYSSWLIGGLAIAGIASWPIISMNLIPDPNIEPSTASCSRLVSGMPISNFVDWQFSNVLVQSLGNLSEYQTVAKCRDQKWTGVLLLSDDAGEKKIKKLTPTE